jgi:hypothetical protein
MAHPRTQQPLYQEKSETMVTPLAQELRERLDWALPEGDPGSSKDDGASPLWAEQADMQPADPLQGQAERPGRSLPGVRAPFRNLRVVSTEQTVEVSVPALPKPTPPSPVQAPPAPQATQGPVSQAPPRCRPSESGLREASELLKAAAPAPAVKPPVAPPAPARRPSSEKVAPARSAVEDPIDAASTSDWAAVVTSAPAPAPRPTAPEPAVAAPEPASVPAPEPAAPSTAPPREKTSPALMAVASLMAVGLLGVALGGNTVRVQARRLPQLLLGAGRAPGAAPGPGAALSPPGAAPGAAAPGAAQVRGMVMATAALPAAAAPACVRDSSQTISSGERDQLLLDAVRAFEKGKQERAQELFQRYVQEACDSATLEALGLLNKQLAPAGRGGSR